MTTPNFRALRAAAVQSCLSQREEILSAFIAKYGFHPEMAVQVEQRQADGTSTWRIELAQPEGEGPTDEEIEEWHGQCASLTRLRQAGHHWASDLRSDEVVDVVRAALARWGRPIPQQIPVSERSPGEGET